MGSPSQALGKPLVIAIAGGSGSGKTLLAQSLMSVLPPGASVFLSQDSYYRSLPAQYSACPENYNFDHPDALEWELLARHLAGLRRLETVKIPRYCFVTHQRVGSDQVGPAPFLVLEGTLILHDPRLVELSDLRVFLEVDDDIRLLRRIARDTRERGRSLESVLEQYVRTVRPMFERFVSPTMRKANLVLQDAPIEQWTRAVLERIKKIEEPR
ncbi:MAG: uridine kinase [Acidobacteria bacterium]|nr:MAG: uridine kinase [Acidobacteriota bacterium]